MSPMEPETSVCFYSTETNYFIATSISLLYILHSLWQCVSANDSGHFQVSNMQKKKGEDYDLKYKKKHKHIKEIIFMLSPIL
jgi:hypothetical protein